MWSCPRPRGMSRAEGRGAGAREAQAVSRTRASMRKTDRSTPARAASTNRKKTP